MVNYEDVIKAVLKEQQFGVSTMIDGFRTDVFGSDKDEWKAFYNKLLLEVTQYKGRTKENDEKLKEMELYCKSKTKSIVITEHPDDIKLVLKAALSVDRENAGVVIRSYYELTTKRDTFYSELLKEAKQPAVVKLNPYKSDAIRAFCEEQINERNFWRRNDWANTKWIGTSLFTLASIVVSVMSYQKKSEPSLPIIIAHKVPITEKEYISTTRPHALKDTARKNASNASAASIPIAAANGRSVTSTKK